MHSSEKDVLILGILSQSERSGMYKGFILGASLILLIFLILWIMKKVTFIETTTQPTPLPDDDNQTSPVVYE